jgi:hypothetical protein
MPRAMPETRFRRFMMQGIMWIILGGTVGLAALLDRGRASALRVELGEPSKFDGFSIRLPKGWDRNDALDGDAIRIELTDPRTGIDLTIDARPPGPIDRMRLYRGRRRDRVLETIPFGDGSADVTRAQVLVDNQYLGTELVVTRQISPQWMLGISMVTPAPPEKVALGRELGIIKQVAASVKVEPAH